MASIEKSKPVFYVCESDKHSLRTFPVIYNGRCPECGNENMRLVDWNVIDEQLEKSRAERRKYEK